MSYARSSRAFGFCDRCSLRWPLTDLRSEFDTGVSRNNRVCPDCWDGDHPQNFLFLVNASDPMTLKDPRPDQNVAASRALWVQVKVKTPMMTGRVGVVTVSTS